MINVYPFNSKEVVLAKDNKVVTMNDEGALSGFVMFEKDKVDGSFYDLRNINRTNFQSIWGNLDFFSPVCKVPEMTRPITRVYRNDVNNLLKDPEVSADPAIYEDAKQKAFQKYIRNVEEVGLTHVIYGFVYGDDGDPEEIIERCVQLEQEILNLN